MLQTDLDLLRKVFGDKKSGRMQACCLRSRAWLSWLLWRTGLEADAFAARYVYNGRTKSNLVARWINGSVAPTEHSVHRINKALPGCLQLYDLPIFKLLEDRPMSASEVLNLIEPYNNPDHLKEAFGNGICSKDAQFSKMERSRSISFWMWDSQSLVERGDLWGFQMIVGMVRLAEARGEQTGHLQCAKDMFRALPSALKEPWLRPHLDLLFRCLEDIRRRVVYTGLIFDVDLDVIRRAAMDRGLQPRPMSYERNCQKRRARYLEDPILEGHVVSGRMANQGLNGS
jgi:hypothetical protein